MKAVSGARLTAVWAVLSAVTIVAWVLGRTAHDVGPTSSLAVTTGVLVIGLAKTRLVLQEFMEVRTAPTWLRVFTDGWLLLFWGAVLAVYLV